MIRGNPAGLIIEELVGILEEISWLAKYTQDVIDVTEDKSEGYALVWFLYNVKQYRESIIQIAYVLGGKDGRPLKQYYDIHADPINTQATLYDVKSQFERVKRSVMITKLAYCDYIAQSSVLGILFVVVDRQQALLGWNLKQAAEAHKE